MTAAELWQCTKTIISSVAMNKKLVLHGFVLLALHVAGVLLLYDLVQEFDVVPHFWFGYVLSEYSSVGANSVNVQLRLISTFQKHGWTKATFRKIDYLVRLAGFMLIGGFLWESLELAFSSALGIRPDSFFAFPITLRSIDGAIDVSVGILGATSAFFWTHKNGKEKDGA